jgi:hypothetical protein
MSTTPSDKNEHASQKPAAEAPTPPAGNKESTAVKQSQVVKVISRITGIVAVLILAAGMLAYGASPATIRQPTVQHYHFRMQIVADGKPVNFASVAFQEGYSKDNCNAELTARPFHFHDKRDQMVHVHWDDMTGGLLLKYYGWNYTGGLKNSLGYRFDNFPKAQSIPIHGQALPKLADNDKFFVYTGDEHGYQERSWNDFLREDFENFFNKKSNLDEEQASLLDKLFPKAYAHDTEVHGAEGEHLSDDQLKSINNLLGNVVIFVQKTEPSSQQIKERFDHLIPLEASVCGG